MKKLILIGVIMLAGCATSVPVKMSFPNVPEDLLKSCPVLKSTEANTTKLSEVITVVSENYGLYHECSGKVDDWTQWYKTQKKIFEGVQ